MLLIVKINNNNNNNTNIPFIKATTAHFVILTVSRILQYGFRSDAFVSTETSDMSPNCT